MSRYTSLQHPQGLAASPGAAMRDLFAIPYARDGRDPRPVALGGDGGVDCYGLCRLAAERLGLEGLLPVDPAEALIGEEALARELPPGLAAIPGDGLLWPSQDDKRPHLALCLDAFWAIHTTAREGVRLHRIAMLRLYRVKHLRFNRRTDGR